MSIQTIQTAQQTADHVVAAQEFAVDRLTCEFGQSVTSVAESAEKIHQMYALLTEFNPNHQPINVGARTPEAHVLSQVVAGIYAPLIHGYTHTIIKNIKEGHLPPMVVAPPRDAIPLAVSLQTQAEIQGVDVTILEPQVNRNTAGIVNNQREGEVAKNPLLPLHIAQIAGSINGSWGAVEIETGIYGTTSLVMAEAFRSEGIQFYAPTKFYGLGPNMSYLHALLSGGEWIAENADVNGLIDTAMILITLTAAIPAMDSKEEHYNAVRKSGLFDQPKLIL